MLHFSKLQPINAIFTNYAKSSRCATFSEALFLFPAFVLLLRSGADGCINCTGATSWRSGDACRAVVSATTLTTL